MIVLQGGEQMNGFDFVLTAAVFSSLGYGLCYLAMAKPHVKKTDTVESQEDFLKGIVMDD